VKVATNSTFNLPSKLPDSRVDMTLEGLIIKCWSQLRIKEYREEISSKSEMKK